MIQDRRLLLTMEGAPLCWASMPMEIKTRVLEYPDDDAELLRIWEVYGPLSYAPSRDITEQFALTWAKEFRFGDGIEKAEVLAPFPAFIREIAGDKLLAKWQAEIVAALPILPNPIKRHVAA